MAYESDRPVSFCFKFARSGDLRKWEKIPGLVFTGERREYSACPVIRYFRPYYYVIYLHAAIPGHNGWVSFLARSKDLATWQLSPRSPILEAGPGEGSNNSDVDLVEIDGKTYVYYCTGDQQTWGDLKRAVYPGPMAEFFAGYFPAGQKTIEVSARQPPEKARPKDQYHNGGFWATPVGWFAYTLDLVDPGLADRTVIEMVRNFQRRSVVEWVFREKVGVTDYVANAALPLAGIDRMIQRRRQQR